MSIKNKEQRKAPSKCHRTMQTTRTLAVRHVRLLLSAAAAASSSAAVSSSSTAAAAAAATSAAACAAGRRLEKMSNANTKLRRKVDFQSRSRGFQSEPAPPQPLALDATSSSGRRRKARISRQKAPRKPGAGTGARLEPEAADGEGSPTVPAAAASPPTARPLSPFRPPSPPPPAAGAAVPPEWRRMATECAAALPAVCEDAWARARWAQAAPWCVGAALVARLRG